MNTKQEKELLDIMMANLEESEFISNNYDKALVKLRDNFRKSLKVELEKRLGKEKYTIENGNPVKNKISQLWIYLNSSSSPKFLFGVESFSGTGHKNGVMFVGLIDMNKSPLIAAIPEENRLNGMWKQVRYFKTKDKNTINLSDKYTLKILTNKEPKPYQNLLNTCCDHIVKFINDYEVLLPKELFNSNIVEKE